MAIEIYDRAKKIHKDGIVYYMVKWGSKNCFNCGGQNLVDNDLHSKWTQKETRESDWHVIGKRKLTSPAKMADTLWNATTGDYYGEVRFGNKRNIALYLDKTPLVDYNDLDMEQQANFDSTLRYSEGVDQKYSNSLIDLDNIPEDKKVRKLSEYAGKHWTLGLHSKDWQGKRYWDLDNL
jgi:hypothetical protein